MDLRLKIKAIQSLQSFSPELRDEINIFGEILGVPVTINSPSPELLQKLDELIFGLSQRPDENNAEDEPIEYQIAPDYALGGLVDD